VASPDTEKEKIGGKERMVCAEIGIIKERQPNKKTK
jgi:hypothetical protein